MKTKTLKIKLKKIITFLSITSLPIVLFSCGLIQEKPIDKKPEKSPIEDDKTKPTEPTQDNTNKPQDQPNKEKPIDQTPIEPTQDNTNKPQDQPNKEKPIDKTPEKPTKPSDEKNLFTNVTLSLKTESEGKVPSDYLENKKNVILNNDDFVLTNVDSDTTSKLIAWKLDDELGLLNIKVELTKNNNTQSKNFVISDSKVHKLNQGIFYNLYVKNEIKINEYKTKEQIEQELAQANTKEKRAKLFHKYVTDTDIYIWTNHKDENLSVFLSNIRKSNAVEKKTKNSEKNIFLELDLTIDLSIDIYKINNGILQNKEIITSQDGKKVKLTFLTVAENILKSVKIRKDLKTNLEKEKNDFSVDRVKKNLYQFPSYYKTMVENMLNKSLVNNSSTAIFPAKEIPSPDPTLDPQLFLLNIWQIFEVSEEFKNPNENQLPLDTNKFPFQLKIFEVNNLNDNNGTMDFVLGIVELNNDYVSDSISIAGYKIFNMSGFAGYNEPNLIGRTHAAWKNRNFVIEPVSAYTLENQKRQSNIWKTILESNNSLIKNNDNGKLVLTDRQKRTLIDFDRKNYNFALKFAGKIINYFDNYTSKWTFPMEFQHINISIDPNSFGFETVDNKKYLTFSYSLTIKGQSSVAISATNVLGKKELIRKSGYYDFDPKLNYYTGNNS